MLSSVLLLVVASLCPSMQRIHILIVPPSLSGGGWRGQELVAETLKELDEAEGVGNTAGGVGASSFNAIRAQQASPGLQPQPQSGAGAGAGAGAEVGAGWGEGFKGAWKRDGRGRHGQGRGRKRASSSSSGGGGNGLRGNGAEAAARADPETTAQTRPASASPPGSSSGGNTASGAMAAVAAGGMGLDRALSLKGVANVGKDKPAWQR